MKREKSTNIGGVHAWYLAARPKTLSGAGMPVLLALVFSWCESGGKGFRFLPALLCLLFALVMQILANFVNDYFDFRHGLDDGERLGPLRACAQGWISERGMRRGIFLTMCLAGVSGLPLVCYGGWWMLVIGGVCMLLCFFYTLGGASHALGDLLVVLCFGIIPVCATYYLQLSRVGVAVFLMSVACGLVVDTLLVVNNYRDYPTDLRKGKRTLVVLTGRQRAERLYLFLPFIAWFLSVYPCIVHGWWCTLFLPIIYLFRHWQIYLKMKTIGHGKALNVVLADNSLNMLLFGLTISAGRILDYFY